MGEAGADFLKEKMKKFGHVASISNELSYIQLFLIGVYVKRYMECVQLLIKGYTLCS